MTDAWRRLAIGLACWRRHSIRPASDRGICAIMTFGLVAFLAAPAESLENRAPYTLNDSSDLADRTPVARGDRLRQSDSAAPRVSGDAPTRRYDAGGSIVWPGYGGPPNGGGGWFTVGSGRWRLQMDYLHRERREERSVIRYTYVEGSTTDSLVLFVSRHFRADRRIKTHLLFGAGYYDLRNYACDAPRPRPEETPVSYERADTCDGTRRETSEERRVLGALGAGMEMAYGSGFFLRAQTRGVVVTERYDGGALWVSILGRSLQAIASELVVGVGVRF